MLSDGGSAPGTRGIPKGPEAALHFPGLPGPDPGNFLYAQKVTKKAPGDPDPSFCLIGRNQGLHLVATEIPCGRWPLVIGAVHIGLRLTALGLIGTS